MHRIRPARAARCAKVLSAAALVVPLALTSCTITPADDGPSDVRVVELSDEAADKIATLVADRVADQVADRVADRVGNRLSEHVVIEMPQPMVRAKAPVVIRRAPSTVRRAPAAASSRIKFPTAESVDAAELQAAADNAVSEALAWLSRHQSEDGSWKPGQLTEAGDAAKGNDAYTPGVTGLSLLCLLRSGESHVDGPHSATIKKGLRYLKNIQDSEGCFGPRTTQHFLYNHALATLAMIEAYSSTDSALFRGSAQSGVNFVLQAQNPYLGWRYGIRDGDNDTSMTCWMVQVLAAAQKAELEVDAGAFRGALAWTDKMTEPEFGRVGYNRRGGPPARTMEAMERFPAEHSEAITAAGLLIRLLSGQRPETSEMADKSAALISRKPPYWNTDLGTNDFYYWHLGTAALRRVGGERWTAWRNSLHANVTQRQNTGGGESVRGSWEPVDAWSTDGGRVYATATLCLSLQEMLISLK